MQNKKQTYCTTIQAQSGYTDVMKRKNILFIASMVSLVTFECFQVAQIFTVKEWRGNEKYALCESHAELERSVRYCSRESGIGAVSCRIY